MSILVAAFALAACASLSGSSGWTLLVDGAKGMDNFYPIGDANWRAEDGAIVADPKPVASYLISKNSYSDFEIDAEFWADHTTNSGIFLRLSNTKEVTAANSTKSISSTSGPIRCTAPARLLISRKWHNRCRRPVASGTPSASLPKASG